MDHDNEIWDEFQWEKFMREQDKKVERYMELFYRYKDDPNRDQIIAREMGWRWLLDSRDDHSEDSYPVQDGEMEEYEEGEEWKRAAGIDDESDEFDSFKS